MPDDDDADVVYVVRTQRRAQVAPIAHVANLIAAGTHSPNQTATRRRRPSRSADAGWPPNFDHY